MLRLRALINQSSLVYADANTARRTLCPYQLKESGQQSIILHVTRNVVQCRVCKQCMHSHLCVFLYSVHVSLLNYTERHPAVCGYFLIYKR